MLIEQALSKAAATRLGDVSPQAESNQYPHLMIDTETMARGPRAAPIAIGAVPFSVEERQLGDPLRLHVDLKDAFDRGFSIEVSTTKFWMQQSDDWLEMQRDAVGFEKALRSLALAYDLWCEEGAKVWARGTDFDFGFVLRPAYDEIGEPLPWDYSAQRDQRTLGFDRPEHDYGHDPVADAYAQARQIVDAGGSVRNLLLS